jgi:hypothetical protein
MIRTKLLPLACAALLSAGAFAFATNAPAPVPVATVVTIATPPGITRERLNAGFKAAIPTYEEIPGLQRKYFTVNETSFGGIYLWKDRALAEAWFTEQWRAKAKATYGSEPQLAYFEVPEQIDTVGKRAQ